MSYHKKSAEFIGVVDEHGNIRLPADLLRNIESKVHVRLTPVHLGTQLRDRGVSEEEVEHIGAVQLESREQVVKFLLSEGALISSITFRRRARKMAQGRAA